MTVPPFRAFRSTVTPPNERNINPTDKWLVDPRTGCPVGLLNPMANGADARFTPVNLTAAQIATPTSLMLVDLDATYRLESAPYTRYMSNGTALVSRDNSTQVQSVTLRAPLPADVEAIVEAVTPSNVALTIAAQPVHARKLQYDIVIGTATTTKITAGTLTTVGFDQDGNAITEVISLITLDSVNIPSAYAWSSVTSSTVAGYVASGSGTGNTLSVGLTDDFGMPTGRGTVNSFEAVAITTTTTDFTGGTVVSAPDDVSAATVDATARTIAPDTAPDADGLIDFQFTYAFSFTG
jgi:hypothetical protein